MVFLPILTGKPAHHDAKKLKLIKRSNAVCEEETPNIQMPTFKRSNPCLIEEAVSHEWQGAVLN